jgi:hypothetical protein
MNQKKGLFLVMVLVGKEGLKKPQYIFSRSGRYQKSFSISEDEAFKKIALITGS